MPVQSAVGGEDIAERGGQVGAQRRVSPEHFVIHRVAVEHQRAAPFQCVQQRRLARAGAAGDAEDKGAVRLLCVEARGLFQPVADGEAKSRAVGTLRPDGGYVRRVEGAQRVEHMLSLGQLVGSGAKTVDDMSVKQRRVFIEADDAAVRRQVGGDVGGRSAGRAGDDGNGCLGGVVAVFHAGRLGLFAV